MIAIHICAPNDENGNPQRCYAVLDVFHSRIFAVVDEGYEGKAALQGEGLPPDLQVIEHRINVNVAEYRRWLAIGEEQDEH